MDERMFRLLMIVGLAAVAPIGVYHRIKAHTSEPLDRRQEGCVVLAVLRPVGIAFMAGAIVYAVNPARMQWSSVVLPAWTRWTGVAMLFAASPLLLWTLHSLGRNLTDTVVTRNDHTLVIRGPYAFVRHPFYCCVALLIVSTSLVAANWFLMVTGAIALGMLVVRTPIEEAKLVTRFGDDYRNYMTRTNRFVPAWRRRR
jgi:protein-S-isoprenylcysteine O-methyltransferase Ste14